MKDINKSSELDIEKLKNEIDFLKIQKKNDNFRLRFDVVKTLLLFIGAIYLFFIIQFPDSLEQRKTKQLESHLKLFENVKDILSEEDTKKRIEMYTAFRIAFPDKYDWIHFIDRLNASLEVNDIFNSLSETMENEEFDTLIDKRNSILDQVERYYVISILSLNSDGRFDFSGVPNDYQETINVINSRILEIIKNEFSVEINK